METKAHTPAAPAGSFALLRNYAQLGKLRLSSLVVFTAAMGYAFALPQAFGGLGFWVLCVAGLLVTISANSINQIIEVRLDAQMPRTANRPLPAGRMSRAHAATFAAVTGAIGLSVLFLVFNTLAGMLGLVSLLAYAFGYTPLKRLHPAAVWVGALPGALPPLIGWVAATGSLGTIGMWLFAVQYFWQFPHFWVIAWLKDADYRAAGYQLLPAPKANLRINALYILMHSLPLLLLSYGALGYQGLASWAAWGGLALSGLLIMGTLALVAKPTRPNAVKLLVGALGYLPILFILLFLGIL